MSSQRVEDVLSPPALSFVTIPLQIPESAAVQRRGSSTVASVSRPPARGSAVNAPTHMPPHGPALPISAGIAQTTAHLASSASSDSVSASIPASAAAASAHASAVALNVTPSAHIPSAAGLSSTYLSATSSSVSLSTASAPAATRAPAAATPVKSPSPSPSPPRSASPLLPPPRPLSQPPYLAAFSDAADGAPTDAADDVADDADAADAADAADGAGTAASSLRARPAAWRSVPASLSSVAQAWVSLRPRARRYAHWLLLAAWQGALTVPHQVSPEAPLLLQLLLLVYARGGLGAADWAAYVARPGFHCSDDSTHGHTHAHAHAMHTHEEEQPLAAAASIAAEAGLFPSKAAACVALLAPVPTSALARFSEYAATLCAGLSNYSAHNDGKVLPRLTRAVFVAICLRAPPVPAALPAALARERWRRRLLGSAAGAEYDLPAAAAAAATDDWQSGGAAACAHWRRVCALLATVLDDAYDCAPAKLSLGPPGQGVTAYYSSSVTEAEAAAVGAALHAAGATSYNTRLFAAPPLSGAPQSGASQGLHRRRLVLSVFAALPRVGQALSLPPPLPILSFADADADAGGSSGDAGGSGVSGPAAELQSTEPTVTSATVLASPAPALLRVVYEDTPPGALARAAACLSRAEAAAPAPAQARFVAALTKHLLAGDGDDHVAAQRLWVRHPPRNGVDANLGFVESYRDCFGARGEWEGFVSLPCPRRAALAVAARRHLAFLARRVPCPTGSAKLVRLDLEPTVPVSTPAATASDDADTDAGPDADAEILGSRHGGAPGDAGTDSSAGGASTRPAGSSSAGSAASASAVSEPAEPAQPPVLLGFAGSGVPTGVNLPNYARVRDAEGFRSVDFSNVATEAVVARGGPLLPPGLRAALAVAARDGTVLVAALAEHVAAAIGVLVRAPDADAADGAGAARVALGAGAKSARRQRARRLSRQRRRRQQRRLAAAAGGGSWEPGSGPSSGMGSESGSDTDSSASTGSGSGSDSDSPVDSGSSSDSADGADADASAGAGASNMGAGSVAAAAAAASDATAAEPEPAHPVTGLPLSLSGYDGAAGESPAAALGSLHAAYEATRQLFTALHLLADAQVLRTCGYATPLEQTALLGAVWVAVSLDGLLGLSYFHPDQDQDQDQGDDHGDQSDSGADSDTDSDGVGGGAVGVGVGGLARTRRGGDGDGSGSGSGSDDSGDAPLPPAPDVDSYGAAAGSWSLARAQAAFGVAATLLRAGLLRVDVTYAGTRAARRAASASASAAARTAADVAAAVAAAHAEEGSAVTSPGTNAIAGRGGSGGEHGCDSSGELVAAFFAAPPDLARWRVRAPPAGNSPGASTPRPRVRVWLDARALHAMAAGGGARVVGAVAYRLQLHRACAEPFEGLAYLDQITAVPRMLLRLRAALLSRARAPLLFAQPHTVRVSLAQLQRHLAGAPGAVTAAAATAVAAPAAAAAPTASAPTVVPRWSADTAQPLDYMAAALGRKTDIGPRGRPLYDAAWVRGEGPQVAAFRVPARPHPSPGQPSQEQPPALHTHAAPPPSQLAGGPIGADGIVSKRRSQLSTIPELRSAPTSASSAFVSDRGLVAGTVAGDSDDDGDDEEDGDTDYALLTFPASVHGVIDAALARYCWDAPSVPASSLGTGRVVADADMDTRASAGANSDGDRDGDSSYLFDATGRLRMPTGVSLALTGQECMRPHPLLPM